MKLIQIPIVHGTPVKQVLESLIKAMVNQHGYKREVVESEIYWAMAQNRMITRRFKDSPPQEDL